MRRKKHNRRWFIETASVGLLGLGACGTSPNSTEKDQETGISTETTSPPTSSPSGTTNTGETNPPADPPSSPVLCEETTEDIAGPFYRENPPWRVNLADGELGTPLTIRGVVYADDCQTPLQNAVVDVWQADTSGAYDNSSEAFRLRGQMQTNAQGEYEYKTILPGRYRNGATYRPRHIHYQVQHTTEAQNEPTTLITQLYFEGDEYLASDPWAEKSRTIALEEVNGEFEGIFDIVLAVSA